MPKDYLCHAICVMQLCELCPSFRKKEFVRAWVLLSTPNFGIIPFLKLDKYAIMWNFNIILTSYLA